MKIFYFLMCVSLSFYFLRLFKRKIRLKKQFDIYLFSLKELKFGSKKPYETKIILDRVSINGIKLINYSLIFLIPYLFCFITSFALFKNYTLSIICSSLPYFPFFISNDD